CDGVWSPAMADLQSALQDLARHIEYPPTPRLAAAVHMRITFDRRRTQWRRSGALRLALAAAVLIAALGASALLVPPVRDIVAKFFHVQGVVIERHTVTPSPTAGNSLEFGTQTSLERARKDVTFPITLPGALGSPAGVYVATPPPGGEVSLVYAPGPGLPEAHSTGFGLLLTEFRGSVVPEFLGKIVGPGATVQEVDVAATRGYWISGSPHAFFYRQGGGNPTDEPLRLADNTLLWERNGVTLRIESSLDREAALRTANSIH
ncbi:MAG TPA: hypothetical protein VGR61_00870, partial [Candidatus Dormibacteraeota bacterium]|nr:hypothetical protein [Candidatus Dormibacteraeota bacterium]